MSAPDPTDFENQRKARVSWEEPEKTNSGFHFKALQRFRGSRIARRIVLYNVFSLIFLLVAFLSLTQSQTVASQYRVDQIRVVTDLVGAQLETGNQTLLRVTGHEVRLFSEGQVSVLELQPFYDLPEVSGFMAFLQRLMNRDEASPEDVQRSQFESALEDVSKVEGDFPTVFLVDAGPSNRTILVDRVDLEIDGVPNVLVVSTPLGQLDAETRVVREGIMRAFFSAVAVGVGLSIILAYSIATPIHELADAAERGRDLGGSVDLLDQIAIPKLHGRPDEIGRLSVAMRDMTKALYEQIDHNQRFAADVTHEIKNPLASVSSAVQGLMRAKSEEQRDDLEKVLMHDVNRMDRLITDISQASKLDADLVREERVSFDLGHLLEQIVGFHEIEAKERGIEIVLKKPDTQLFYMGLENRLAQVFSNLISNAVSICDMGDTITVWSFVTQENVFVMVEDSGPGIPEQNLEDIFKRFYSNRAESAFGRNSGLGLAISKQIVEGHQGRIWAENIYANEDATGPRQGARFVTSLPRV